MIMKRKPTAYCGACNCHYFPAPTAAATFFTGFSHPRRYPDQASLPEAAAMDAVFLLILAGLYLLTLALTWALERLGKSS
jgi:hypothetical protein